jgi:hypothetical protein
VKRTVVDLSFSFFITLNFAAGRLDLSLPQGSIGGWETAERYLTGIAWRTILPTVASDLESDVQDIGYQAASIPPHKEQ